MFRLEEMPQEKLWEGGLEKAFIELHHFQTRNEHVFPDLIDKQSSKMKKAWINLTGSNKC